MPPRAASAFVRDFFHNLTSVFAPDDCRLCDQPLLHASLAPVCDDCLQQITPQHLALCSRCGESLGFEFRAEQREHEWLCTVCRQVPPPFAIAKAYGVYDGTLRAAIHGMKFHGIPALANTLAPLLAKTIGSLATTAPQTMTVIAVPLYRGKRSFNQSKALADHAVQIVHREHPQWKLKREHSLLRRTRSTQSQFQLSPRQRRLNLRGAFTVTDPARLAGRDVLLVDDIYTTGATARECSRTLLAAGAASVSVVTLARSQRLSAMRWTPPAHLKSIGAQGVSTTMQ